MTAHLIAATLTAALALAISALLRHRSAALRHAILLAALLSFAVPAPWLNQAGDKLAACLAVSPSAPLRFGFEPLHLSKLSTLTSLPALSAPSQFGRDVLLLLWAMISAFSLATWLRRLLQAVPSVREANPAEAEAFLRARTSLALRQQVSLRITTADRVPGARGWLRPCVILPDQLSEQLSEAELLAILAHELAHIARRDNLSAALARVIVAVFWFHPLLWWIERRMLAEREAACDEHVLAHGAEPADYISAILKVCRMSFEGGPSGAASYASATGSNLQHRMEQIMSAHAVRPSSRFRRAIPVALLALAAILPLSVGFLRAQDRTPADPQTYGANDAIVKRATEFFNQRKFQEAEDLFRQMYAADPDDFRGPIGLGESLVAQNRIAEAIQLMQHEVARNFPPRVDAQTALANLYVRAEEYDLAIAQYQQLLDSEKDPQTRAGLLYRLGEANRRKGDLNEAMRLFRASAGASPKNPTSALLAVALLLDGSGRGDEAASIYERILKIEPDQQVALNNLSYLVAEGGHDPDRALDLAQRAARQAKDAPQIQDTLGMAYLKRNQPDQAAAAFRAAIQSQPRNPTFHYHLALALLPIGERELAIQELQAALDNHPFEDVSTPARDLLNKIAP